MGTTRKSDKTLLARRGVQVMPEVNSVVAIYDSHSQAVKAMKELRRSGVDVKKMSIVGDVKTGRVLLVWDGPWAFPFEGLSSRRARGRGTTIQAAA
jgi:hypothetical protein